MYKFNYVGSADGSDDSIVIVSSEGETRTLNSSHPNYHRVYEFLFGDDSSYFKDYEDEEEWLLEQAGNVLSTASKNLTRLSERVTFDGNYIYFDGDKIDNNLSRHLVRMLRNDDQNFIGLVNFMEKVATNPSPLARRHVFTWLNNRDFTITPDGDIIGYKAVQGTPDNLSITRGSNKVFVDGVEHTGNIPNPIGAVVEIARGDVDPDRGVACSYGLHVGTHEYASWFGGGRNILTVAVNPRDVVSVPSDHEDQKMRVARYVVLEVSGLEKIEDTTLDVEVHQNTYLDDYTATFVDDEDDEDIS